jgi:hypothetical protein
MTIKISQMTPAATPLIGDEEVELALPGSNPLTRRTTTDDIAKRALIVWEYAISDEATAITTGTSKIIVRARHAMTVVEVRASLSVQSSSGAPQFDINVATVSMLSTKLTIDASERTSVTAATPAVISDATIDDDAEITIDIDTAGTGAKGAKIAIIGHRP